MHFLKPLFTPLALCCATMLFVFAMVAPAVATETAHTDQEKSAEIVPFEQAESPQPALSSPETVKTAATGAYYRIDDNSFAYYEKPTGYGFLVNTPLNIVDWLKDSFRTENALTIAGITVMTAGLLAIDQEIYEMSRNIGHSLKITDDDRMGGRIPITSQAALKYPDNLGSLLYYLGDGMIPISITAGLFGYGYVTSDVRSLQTASQMAEGLLSVALVVQILKRSTGHEVPRIASEPGGKWRPFPGFNDYNKHTPKYDAFPSGHLATSMMTITVLSENYPEYTFIKPLGYTVMTVLGFQMINNGVHWASDYPLAIAIGYGLGKVAVSKGRKVVTTGEVPAKALKLGLFNDMTILPMPMQNGGALHMIATF
jgi:hypothetical protein